jgi:excisionase family DNA binding protein
MLTRDTELYFSLADAARILGYERSSIYARVKEGKIRTVKFADGAKRIPRSELLRYVGNGKPAQAAE